MLKLLNIFVTPIAYLIEEKRRLTAALLTIIFIAVPAYVIGSTIYAEAKLDEVKLVRESNSPEVLKDGLQSSRFIGPKSSKSKIISSLDDAKPE